MKRSPAVLAAAIATLAACGGGSASSSSGIGQHTASTPVLGGASATAAPPVASFAPDVPAWRGGCFYSGPAGKIVNGSPSADVRSFGGACATPPTPGGIVYLDRYDPVTGAGNVTVLSSAPGSTPVVVGKNGGAGGIIDGSTGARFDGSGTKLLTLADVGYVTGRLVLVDLTAPASPRAVASNVRVENYDFAGPGGDAVLYVGNYDATQRQGDLFYWAGATPQLIAAAASRFDFYLYRLAPGGTRVAWLTGYSALGGGELHVATLPPSTSPAAPLDSGVRQVSWTVDGRSLVWVAGSGASTAVRSWDGVEGHAPRTLATGVDQVTVVGSTVVVATGWSVLFQHAAIHAVDAATGTDALLWADASLGYSAFAPAASGGDQAPPLLVLPTFPAGGLDASDFRVASLGAAPTSAGPVLDTGVSPAAGFRVSPRGTFIAYARGYQDPQASGSANAQPGIAREVKVVPTAGGAPFLLASGGAMRWVAWAPDERLVAALGDFDPAADRGSLVVRDTASGTQRYTSAASVSSTWFDFSDDGSVLAALRGWDAGLLRGELVLVPTGGASAWREAVVDDGVTFYQRPRGARVIYGVRGGGRDGLWLGGAP